MEALEALGINTSSLFWHTLNFLLLVVLLSRFLYKPVVKMLDERAARIRESMERAEFIKQQLAQSSEEIRLNLDKARREAQEIVDQAGLMAERMKVQGRQDAQAEADRIVARARAQIEHERQQAMAELRREVADLVVAAAGKVIGQSLDDRIQRRLIDEFAGGNGQKLND